jgi:hypothetical protein
MLTMVLGGFAGRLAGSLIAAGISLSMIPAALSAPPSGGAIRGPLDLSSPAAEPIRYRRGSYCDTLRRACLYKGSLGERGLGNCSQYRAECRGYSGYRERRYYSRERYRYYRDYWDYGHRPSRRYRYYD